VKPNGARTLLSAERRRAGAVIRAPGGKGSRTPHASNAAARRTWVAGDHAVLARMPQIESLPDYTKLNNRTQTGPLTPRKCSLSGPFSSEVVYEAAKVSRHSAKFTNSGILLLRLSPTPRSVRKGLSTISSKRAPEFRDQIGAQRAHGILGRSRRAP